MDLVETLRSRVDALEEGDHTPGLKAVVRHIETAFGHLDRGHSQQEETAFTDAIYRTNQAFEGSVKEAYRVLAGKNPDKKRPHDIEKYLEDHKVFRSRVLTLFANYRTEWRNPSTHDYKLDFDESEAFLAIVSVSAFACLVADQISQHLAYLRAKIGSEQKKADLQKLLASADQTLLARSISLLCEFSREQQQFGSDNIRKTELQVTGALAGFIATVADDIQVDLGKLLTPDRHVRADMLLTHRDSKLLIELRNAKSARRHFSYSLDQVSYYLLLSSMKEAIMYFYADEPYEPVITEHAVSALDARIVMIHPEEALPSKMHGQRP